MATRASRLAVSLLLAAAIAAAPRAAAAWGQNGHVIVARIAERHLSPRARRALASLLDGRTLADLSMWADDWKQVHTETAPWHFVDIPLAADDYDARRDCRGGACVVAALGAELAKLADARAPRPERARALRFVVHLVGDLHQPLHAADDGDRGGNAVRARLVIQDDDFPYQSPPASNLHGVWDTDLVDSAHHDQEAYAAALSSLPAPLAEMQAGAAADWALEAHRLARDVVYKLLPAPDPATRVRLLDAAYARRCRPVVELQLQRAGVRLARLLDEALGR